MNKFIEIIKKKWLRDTALTIVLIAIVLAIFIALNLWVSTLNVTELDFTKDQLYTITDETKDLMKNINKETTIYFFGEETNAGSIISFANQYAATNENIHVELTTVTERPDLAAQYGIDANVQEAYVVVTSGEKQKLLSAYDFYTYDSITYETIDITEERLTNAILEVTAEEKPQIYFLTGHGEYSTTQQMISFSALLQNEIMEVNTLDLLRAEFPEKCDVLVIATPSKDFGTAEVEAITKYIQKGGNILWMQDMSATEVSMPNVQKVLDLYGVGFEKGILLEQDDSKMLLQNPQIIAPTVYSHELTRDIYNGDGVMFANAGTLKMAEDTVLEEKHVSVYPLIQSSEQAFLRKNFNLSVATLQEGEEAKSYMIGAECIKEIDENTTSKLVVYANNYFATDATIQAGNQYAYMIQLYNNKDLAINSVAYLAEKEDSIRIRKNTGTVTYTVTEQQDKIVKTIIFGVPILIIATGIVVWILRRRK